MLTIKVHGTVCSPKQDYAFMYRFQDTIFCYKTMLNVQNIMRGGVTTFWWGGHNAHRKGGRGGLCVGRVEIMGLLTYDVTLIQSMVKTPAQSFKEAGNAGGGDLLTRSGSRPPRSVCVAHSILARSSPPFPSQSRRLPQL